MQIKWVVGAEDAQTRLGPYLRRQGVSVHLIRHQKYLADGITVNGLRAKTNQVLHTGDAVALALAEEDGFSAAPMPVPMDIVYESVHALVVNKPAGLVVHPTLSHHDGTLANGFCALMKARGMTGAVFRPIGRLDADTSGLQLCAMNAYAAPILANNADKTYLALTTGPMPEGDGTIEAPLAAEADSAVKQAVVPGGRMSRTDYRVVASGSRAALAVVWPRTGRTHQIRAHFAHIGCPLLGDGMYGGDTASLGRHALHCAALTFCEPGQGPVALGCEMPDDMKELANRFGLTVPAPGMQLAKYDI